MWVYGTDQAWEKATSFADAYRIGKAESSAALNLMNEVPSDVVEKLAEMCRHIFC